MSLSHSAAEDRLLPLRNMLAASGFDAIAFVPGSNFRRIFATSFSLMERPLVIIVANDGEAAAIVPKLEMAAFEKLDFPGPVFAWRDEEGYGAAFAAAADALPGLADASRFGLEAQRMRAFEQMALQKAFPDARLVDAHQALSTIRLVKTPDEIARLKEAIRISEQALEATLAKVRVGQTEKEIEAILLRQMFAHGADGLAFEPIVAAGDNAAQPHAHARADYRIKAGDALLFDFGASHRGYHADITRTFFVAEVSDYDRAFYETVLAANERGRQVARAGIGAHDVDDAVQTLLEASQFSPFIRHKTGHGLGLDVHEAPQIMRGNHDILLPGMVFTIEPGLYREGECGVRIEDDVVVTGDGIECLTSFPRQLRIVG
ncbi:MAG: aminopeptidase P family protein [Nitratireductor sp.]|nr:aminopeptidase P family protein [Nitratireductor sp.]